jgi:hypothetical protein
MATDALRKLISSSGRQQSTAFLESLCARMTDDMLEEIARADYGMDYDAHLAALKSLRAREPAVGQMAWEPKEVLELFRWSEFGDDRSGRTVRQEAEFHLMRAFCCTLLLEAYAEPANLGFLYGNNQTIMQLLESTRFSAPADAAAMAEFFCWLIPRTPDYDEERAYYGLALITAKLRAGETSADNAKFIIEVASATEEEAKALRELWPEGVNLMPNRWLLGWTHYKLMHKKWVGLGAEIGSAAQSVTDAALRQRLERLSRWLTEDYAFLEDE